MALLLIVIGGVLTAFLYPRSVIIRILSINGTEVHNISAWTEEDVANNSFSVLLGVEVKYKSHHAKSMTFLSCQYILQTTLGVKNANFFPVTVAVVNVTLMFYEVEVGFKSYSTFAVQSRSSKNVSE